MPNTTNPARNGLLTSEGPFRLKRTGRLPRRFFEGDQFKVVPKIYGSSEVLGNTE